MPTTVTRAVVPGDVDLFDPRVYARGLPYDAFARLRVEQPVAWHPEPELLGWPQGPGFWAVTRHEDVARVSRTPATFSSWLGATQLRDPDPADLPFVREMMLNMDPPEHSRLRKILNKGFTARSVTAMEPVVQRYARETVDAVAARGECDFAEDIGADFPLLTLAEIMGVPASDRYLLHQWTNRIIGYQDDEYADVPIDPDTGEPLNPRSRRALSDMLDYAHELAAHKREHPGDDLITTLLQAEVDGERVSDEEFENMFFLFTVAGNDTTHSALPGGMLALLEHPTSSRGCATTSRRCYPVRWRRCCATPRRSSTSAGRRPPTRSCGGSRSRGARRSSCSTPPRTGTRRSSTTPTRSTSRGRGPGST